MVDLPVDAVDLNGIRASVRLEQELLLPIHQLIVEPGFHQAVRVERAIRIAGVEAKVLLKTVPLKGYQVLALNEVPAVPRRHRPSLAHPISREPHFACRIRLHLQEWSCHSHSRRSFE